MPTDRCQEVIELMTDRKPSDDLLTNKSKEQSTRDMPIGKTNPTLFLVKTLLRPSAEVFEE